MLPKDQTYYRATVLGDDNGQPELSADRQADWLADSVHAPTAIPGPLHLVMTAKPGVDGEWIVAACGNGPNSEANAKNIAGALTALATIPDPAALVAAAREVAACQAAFEADGKSRGPLKEQLIDQMSAALRRLGEVMK